jgi:hypothetical protein
MTDIRFELNDKYVQDPDFREKFRAAMNNAFPAETVARMLVARTQSARVHSLDMIGADATLTTDPIYGLVLVIDGHDVDNMYDPDDIFAPGVVMRDIVERCKCDDADLRGKFLTR